MTVLTAPRHPLIDAALRDARQWCAGQVIDERPALAHAVRVAVTIGRYAPGATPDLICAALLHDSPHFAPPDIDLDAVLTSRYGQETTRIVRALERQHLELDQGTPLTIADDGPVVMASAADRIVALSSLLHRARLSGDEHRFFASRPALMHLIDYFRDQHSAAIEHLPRPMSLRLALALTAIEQAAGACRHRTRHKRRSVV